MGIDTLFVILAGIVSFVATLVVVRLGKGVAAGIALALIIPLPLLTSVFWLFKGMRASFAALAETGKQPTPFEVDAAIAATLATVLIAMLAMVPSYLLVLGTAVVRSLRAGSNERRSAVI